jgi:hypothetical protein
MFANGRLKTYWSGPERIVPDGRVHESQSVGLRTAASCE